MLSFDEEIEQIELTVERIGNSKKRVEELELFLQLNQEINKEQIKPKEKSNSQILIEMMQKNTRQQNKMLKRLLKNKEMKHKSFQNWVLERSEENGII